MTSVYAPCPSCRGVGGWIHSASNRWLRCHTCDGIGRSWAPGAPSFGCDVTLADRDPGEVVTLGNGDRGKILWHMPRKSKKVRPETTFLGYIDEFTGAESHRPVAYPSCVGVLSVDIPRTPLDREVHDREKSLDLNDPVQRTAAGRLI